MCKVIKVEEDENIITTTYEFEVDGMKYTGRAFRHKICPKTNLPKILSKQRIRWSKPEND